ncbi:2-polyprenyl-6-methoxyphenol hydroxylase [Actinopolyspora mzabensis]|uniref:2-polyprenyl-6-methoxyphenol hydroxylase n=1 Tax=Actinopolyspora mzabensis TaxID=995066 RepID=A0A1G9EGL9_ACTMZ|nr:FAD-dependent monooxygenase [Actinopolyspora mzabensis]SDK75201.1 2-polyprenyl-6-methoxyphenol hydroxylase [Actinopolyspora mzabensis]
MPEREPVLIAGAGIGGLTAALALSRHGFPVEVYERRAEKQIELSGTGLTIWSNATTALAELGLHERLLERGDPVIRAEHRGEKRRLMLLTEVQEHTWPNSTPGVSIARGDLVRMLMEACEQHGVRVHLDQRCLGYETDGSGVTLRLAGGGSARGRVLIGGNGLRSTIREQLLNGETGLTYTGVSTYRGISDSSGGVPKGTAYLMQRLNGVSGGGWHVADGRFAWTVGCQTPEGGRDTPGTMKASVQRMLDGFEGPPRKFVANTPEERIIRTDIHYHEWNETWGDGPVTLLGDAAHALPTILGQGACQAIEDAVVLADALAVADDPVEGLRSYENRRKPRVRWIQDQVFKIWGLQKYNIGPMRWLFIPLGRFFAARSQPKLWSGLQQPPELSANTPGEDERVGRGER